MIVETTPVFPNNVVTIIAAACQTLDSELAIFMRPLQNSDPQQSIGVTGSMWVPNLESYEIGSEIHEPTLAEYVILVQSFVADFDEERGLATSSVLSTLVRTMLSRNAALRVALRSLSVTVNGSEERTRRFSVRTQRFNSGEIDKRFLYLSTLEFWLETETH